MTFMRSLTAVAAVLLAAGTASAATFNESVNGDLSGNRNAPTVFNLTVGSNNLTATTSGGDLDVVTVNVPAGNLLSRLFLRSFSSAGFDERAFVGIQSGSTFSVDPNFAGPAALLGYTHFGTADGNVGSDILPSILNGFGSIGDVQNLTPPLACRSLLAVPATDRHGQHVSARHCGRADPRAGHDRFVRRWLGIYRGDRAEKTITSPRLVAAACRQSASTAPFAGRRTF